MHDSIPSLWNPDLAPTDPVDLLVYASNLLGSDRRVTNFGGGNTSSKAPSIDPLTGESVEVLWVKGSGGDLGSAKRAGFASLYQEKFLGLEARYKATGMAEDDVVPLYQQCVFNLNPAAPSIDTPLHGFVDRRCVSHMHADAVIAIAAAAEGPELTKAIYGDRMGWLPWKRPGFELGLMLKELIVANPKLEGAMMGSHGFICWADDWKACYELTLQHINEAADYIRSRRGSVHAFGPVVCERRANAVDVLADLAPRLRGKVAYQGQRLIAAIDRSEAALTFMEREKLDALAALGTSCPDHFLRTKIRPVVLDPEDDMDAKLGEFRAAYAAYYNRCKHPDSPAMRNPNPSVVLVPGVGMIAFGKTATEARVSGEFYRNAIAVMEGAETVSRYTALPEQEAFNIEYWSLEEAKLRRMPPEKEMSRKIALLIGAGPGIGHAIAQRLLAQGATLVIADMKAELVDQAVSSLKKEFGGDSVYGVTIDITNRVSVRDAIRQVILRYGGIDVLVNIAAIFVAPDLEGRIPDAMWAKTFEVNVTGSAILAEEAHEIMKAQGTGGSIVLISSANAVVAKKGSVAYDTSKAAVNHLVRELAVQFSPAVRVNAVAPATVVAGSQMFPKDRVIASLAKYGIAFDESEDADVLRDRLADFYAQRTLLKRAVTPGSVADAAYLLATDRLALTTGQIISVDAGLADAFLR